MAEEDIVKKLVAQLDETTMPRKIWYQTKENIQKGTAATRSKDIYTKGAKGADVIDLVDNYALDFYSGIGEGGNKDKAILAERLRKDLGRNYGDFKEALEHGDIDQANLLMRTSTENRYAEAKVSASIERIQSLKPDELIAAAKGLVGLVGGTDYAKVISNPGALVGALSAQRQAASEYIKTNAH